MKNAEIVDQSYPPYIHDWKTSARVSWIVACTLLPVILWSSVLYGGQAVRVWVISVLSALIAESIGNLLLRRWTLDDGSAVITGILVATVMPPSIQWYIPAVSAAFGILVVKMAFGGLGANWMNPALGGIAFAYANWPSAMREFIAPRLVSGVDSVSAATPLDFARGLVGGVDSRIMDALHGAGYPLSSFDSRTTGFLNDLLFTRIGARLPEGYIDLAIGLRPGSLGESALLAVLAGSIILIALRIIRVEIPMAMLATFALLVRVFGTGMPGESFLSGDVLFALSGGGIVFASFYMATDPVSSPIGTVKGIVYGASAGLLSFILRRWGAFSEGVVYAVLVMNVMTPFIENTARAMSRGQGKAGKP
jgi:Na+-translocating ferredoxin:NAD+ oxidoreductase subunit D